MVSKSLLKFLHTRLRPQELDTNLLHHVGMQRVDNECLSVERRRRFHIALGIEGIGFNDVSPGIARVARNCPICCQLRVLIVCEIAISERYNAPYRRIVESQLNGPLRKVASSVRLIFT